MFLLFLQVEVIAIQKDYESYQWQVFYHPTGQSRKTEKTVQGNFVFLSAGALGSTKILMQSQKRSLELSDQLGKKFCGNGGLLGMFINVGKGGCSGVHL